MRLLAGGWRFLLLAALLMAFVPPRLTTASAAVAGAEIPANDPRTLHVQRGHNQSSSAIGYPFAFAQDRRLSAISTGAAQPQPSGTFAPAECMFKNATLLGNVECGYLTVPERHNAPDGPKIRLAVAIARSTGENPVPDPLVLAQGGPGGSTIDLFADQLVLANFQEIRRDRDIVMFDQRGTLYAEPDLRCAEDTELIERTIEQRLTREESRRLSLEASLACRERLVREGVDLAAYNSLENAADIVALRDALGYDQINLYGVSYGTLLALHTMQLYPQILRSVILDSVVPRQTNPNSEVPRSMDRAFTELFQACAADPGCNRDYPNLEQVFFDLLTRLDQAPGRGLATDPDTGKTYNAVIDGDTMLSLVFQLLYASSVIPLVPKVITDAANGDFSLAGRFLGRIAFDRTFASGMYYSVTCAEDADFRPEDVNLTGVRPALAERERLDTQAFLTTCQRWSVPELGPAVDQPVRSDVPVLVFNGRFDPITPPSFGETAAQTLSRSVVVTFPTLAHGSMTDSACASRIARAFLDDPAQRPDTSCVTEQTIIRFITPSNTLMTPGLIRMLDAIEQGQFGTLILILLCLVLLLSVFLIWPVAWLIRRSRKLPPEPDTAARLAPWLAAATAVLALAFVVGAVAVVFALSAANDNATLLTGVPLGWAWLFVLPLLTALLAVGMLICAVLAWVRGSWGIARRIYFSLLAFTTAVFTVLLAQAGFLLPLVERFV
jgi:pimeloyl-ACP methyl ester carboxylesterase